MVDDIFSTDEPTSDIAQLKEEIARLIEDALEHNPAKSGFNFYIDDLDRIDPPVAVEILELLKTLNIHKIQPQKAGFSSFICTFVVNFNLK